LDVPDNEHRPVRRQAVNALGNAVIAYDTGDVILLTGVADTEVTAGMFVFG